MSLSFPNEPQPLNVIPLYGEHNLSYRGGGNSDNPVYLFIHSP